MRVPSILISSERANQFNVSHDGVVAESLCWDEMLGQIASLTHSEISAPRFREVSLNQPAPTQEHPALSETEVTNMTEDDFYIVVEGNDRRHARHQTDTSAIEEATRLCRENNSKKFFVLHAFKVAKIGPNVVVEDTDDIPFQERAMWPKRTTCYIGSDKETIWTKGEMLGLTGAALGLFKFALCEATIVIDVNEDGTYKIIEVKE